MDELQQIIKGSALSSAGLIFAKAFGVLFSLLLARSLGPDGLGQFNLSVLLSSWFTVLGLFSIQTVVVQKMAETEANSQEFKKTISAAIFMSLAMGLLASGLHFALSGNIYLFFNKQVSLWHLQIGSAIIFGGILFNTVLGIERGLKHFGNYAVLEAGKAAGVLAIAAGMLFAGYEVGAGITALIFAPIVVSCIMMVVLLKYYDKNFWQKIIPMAKLGIPITLLSILLVVLLNSDRLFLGALQSKTDVGLYSVAITIVAFFGLFFPSAIKNTVFSFVTRTVVANQIEKTSYLLERTITYYISMLSFTILPLMLFRNELIHLIFGEQFIAAANLLAILLFATPFMAVYSIAHSFIVSLNRFKEVIIATLISLAISIPAYILLIAKFGAVGASLATVISTGLLAASYMLILKKAINNNLRKMALLVAVIFLLTMAAFFGSGSLMVRSIYLLALAIICAVFLYKFEYFTKEIELFIKIK